MSLPCTLGYDEEDGPPRTRRVYERPVQSAGGWNGCRNGMAHYGASLPIIVGSGSETRISSNYNEVVEEASSNNEGLGRGNGDQHNM